MFARATAFGRRAARLVQTPSVHMNSRRELPGCNSLVGPIRLHFERVTDRVGMKAVLLVLLLAACGGESTDPPHARADAGTVDAQEHDD